MLLNIDDVKAVTAEFLKHGSMCSIDENGIIKEGTMLMHISKDGTPLFNNERECQWASFHALHELNKMGYDGEPIYSKIFNGFGIKVGKKVVI